MSSVISSTGRRPALLIAGILLIATTLRVVFTGAAPLLDAIRSDYGLTTAQTGLLTTLPLLAFGLVSPLAAGVARRFGMERSLLLAMLLMVFAAWAYSIAVAFVRVRVLILERDIDTEWVKRILRKSAA